MEATGTQQVPRSGNLPLCVRVGQQVEHLALVNKTKHDFYVHGLPVYQVGGGAFPNHPQSLSVSI